MLRKIFELERKGAIGDRRKLDIEEFHKWGDQSKKDEISEITARTGEKRNAYRVYWGDLKGRDYLKDLGVEGWMALNWILK
jgi:hypothetical protein